MAANDGAEVEIEGTGATSVVTVQAGVTAILQGFEITEGIGTQTGNGRYGGGIFNAGTVTRNAESAVIDNKPDNCIGTDACPA